VGFFLKRRVQKETAMPHPSSRRDLLKLIGLTAGTAVLYQAMVEMGYAGTSTFTGPIKLTGDAKGASVLILGAGLAGMVAAYELRKAGYKVQILEFNDRPGGRNWSLYGGDTLTELGGKTQQIAFDKGLYFNPGPWRIPYHHQGILYYCKALNVAMEPFTMVNHNAYVHSARAFGGQPKRFREVNADCHGYVMELLAKATSQDKMDGIITADEKDGLLRMLRAWGALNQNFEYRKSYNVSQRRGFDTPPGGGLNSVPVDSDPLPMRELFNSSMWVSVMLPMIYEFQSQLFQPVGGMGMIGKAFGKALQGAIRYNCQVQGISQDDHGVTATYVDTKKGGPPKTARADWCINTIPASVLSQIPMNVGAPLRNAINSLSYIPAVKVGLQFKRRFWEEDDGIYGGNTYTDQPIFNISYPSHGYFQKGPGILMGAYGFESTPTYMLESLPADDLLKMALEQGARIHPQYRSEYQNGVAIAWHRVPWTMGCSGGWTDELRAQHYANMCAIDGRIVLAGEHCSRLPAWQEGAVLSALDAVTRLHRRVLSA
jgi:monoamine oxidase